LADVAAALAGKRILVTRPRELAQGLADLISGAGGEPVLYPAVEIRDPRDPAAARALLARAGQFELAVFVSPTAVRRACALHAGPWPRRVAAIGEGTRRELAARGFTEVIAPAGRADSEALLELPAMAGWRSVLILRGDGGRALLGDTLAARGARVEVAECYRRARPEGAPLPAGRLDAICVNTSEALENLAGLLGRERMAEAPLFVSHPRIAGLAAQRGLPRTHLAGPGDAEMLAALVAYFGGAK
jgi:uroporphyrinogen-III synthase